MTAKLEKRNEAMIKNKQAIQKLKAEKVELQNLNEEYLNKISRLEIELISNDLYSKVDGLIMEF